MEPVSTLALAQPNVDPNPSDILEQYRQRLLELLREGESNAWDIGDLLNRIEKSGVVRSHGFAKTRTWLEAKVPETQGKTSTLYRYAKVAGQYSREQVKRWGTSMLDYLMIHDKEVLGHLVPGDPAPREIELLQEDGSKVMTKFRECSSNDLRFSNQRRKKATGGSSAAVVAAAPEAASPETHSPLQALALLVLGIVIVPLAELLPSPVSLWVGVVGFCLFFAGLAILIHLGRTTWKRFLSAVKEGKGVAFFKEMIANVRQGTQKIAAAIHFGGKTDPPSRSEELPPPTEKKAA